MSGVHPKTGVSAEPNARWRLGLSASGVVFLLTCGFIFLIGVNYSNNLIFTICFLLLGVFFVSLWLGLRNMSAFGAVCLPVNSVHAGQQLVYKINLIERGGREHWAIDTVAGDRLPSIIKGNDHNRQQWTLLVSAPRRGVQSAKPLRIESRWPLGLMTISRQVCYLPEVVIYPASEDLKALTSRPVDMAAHLHEEAESLAGLRAYQLGDSVRRIDWRAMARRDELQVKSFDGASGDPSTWLHWDDTDGLEYEARIRCLCHWVLSCHQRCQEYGLVLPEQTFELGCDQVQLHQCLTALALLPQSSEKQGSLGDRPDDYVMEMRPSGDAL